MFTVTASQLNLRSTPEPKPDLSNLTAVLPNGQKVDKIADSIVVDWWKVSTNLNGTEFVGFVNSIHLSENIVPTTVNTISEVHLSKTNQNSNRSAKTGLAFPLGENNRPSRDMASSSSKKESIKAILDWLDVQNSIRYLPGGGFTYCNIYAHDFCYLNGVYIPRVWWSENAIIRLSNGEQVPVQYGNTVFEKNANSLLDWFKNWGSTFGWERVATMTALQERANEGKICILVAKRRDLNRSGHIVAVVPENAINTAKRDAKGVVTVPLQSQAGASNQKYFSTNKWWLASENGGPKFSDFMMFSHV